MAVTQDDIAVELGRTAPDSTSPEYGQWGRWISDALMLISARLGDVTALDQDRLDYVVRQAVAAHVRRPDDATQVTVAVDDGQSSRTYRTAKGRVEILDEWWDLLSPTPEDSGKAFSVDTAPITANGHAWWCSVTFGASWCSCGAVIGQDPMFEVIE